MKYEKPYIKLLITTQQGSVITLNNADYGGDVTNYTFSKTIGQPAGNFSFSLPDRRDNDKKAIDFRQAIRAMSMIEVYINGVYRTIGFIISVDRAINITNKGSVKIFNVECVELGYLWQQTQIWYDPSQKAREVFGSQSRVLQITKMNLQAGGVKAIQDILPNIHKQWFEEVYKLGNFKFADGSNLSDRIVVDKSNFADDIWVKNVTCLWSAWNFQGSLWDYFNTFISLPFHEMWGTAGGKTVQLADFKNVELDEGKYYLILRPTPYDDYNLASVDDGLFTRNNIPKITITDEDWFSKKLGCSGKDMMSYYALIYGGSLIPQNYQLQLNYPIYDTETLSRYGKKDMVRKLNAVNIAHKPSLTREQDATLRDILQKLQYKMYSWYKNNDRFLTGSFTCNGNPKADVGILLNYERDSSGNIEDDNEEGTYYVQGFSENYVYGSNYTTTYNVIRGTPSVSGWF